MAKSHFQHRPKPVDRKTLQLCAQVQQVLAMLIDDVCCDCAATITIGRVEPAPHSSHLAVFVHVSDMANAHELETVRRRIETKSSYLRAEVAQSIHRRKTPALSFLCVPEG